MPRASLDAVVEQRLSSDGGGRGLDLCVDMVRCTCELCGPRKEHLLEAGGSWDRVRKEYVGRAERSRHFALQDAQLEAGRWFARWLRARQRREFIPGPDGTPCFTLALVGGRRGGKSDICPKLALAYLVAVPLSIAWLVVPKYPDMPELEASLDGLLPRAWYTALGDPWYEWTLANGSRLEIRSSYNPDDLKRGRCDIAVIHEAQKHEERTYAMLAPAIADKGGLVVLAANPPDGARGEWVSDLIDRGRAGRTDEQVFELDPRLNPHVEHAALDSLKKKLDERTYQREILGLFLPSTDRVFYAFNASPLHGNVRETGRGENGEQLVEVTGAFLGRRLGHSVAGAARVHGLDFQLAPWMAAVTARFFEDPSDPAGDPLLWYTDALQLEQATEDELLDGLEARRDEHGDFTGADPTVIDASGEWQDAERTKGRASADILRRRGWNRIYLPDAKSRRNPPITERLAVLNGLFRNAAGNRKGFVDPRCVDLIRALKTWQNRNGVPNRRADEAHICDAASYLAYRLYPRRAPAAAIGVTLIKRPPRRGLEDIR